MRSTSVDRADSRQANTLQHGPVTPVLRCLDAGDEALLSKPILPCFRFCDLVRSSAVAASWLSPSCPAHLHGFCGLGRAQTGLEGA